ncbi:DUF4326 domain-containing protein [Streptomyces sp. NPDC048290]|uniref:DUF4326 domain-containing protein n=1 Tax=Streptomyces sp. NPDC048290 TaxID=3155811 RepID=UPI0034332528
MAARQATLDRPHRIQRRRLKGWRAPVGAVYIGRGSAWGNPYRLTVCGPNHVVIDSRTEAVIFGSTSDHDARRVAVDWYRAWAVSQPDLAAAARRQLRGRDLMCWCPTELPCHGDVLLELANAA